MFEANDPGTRLCHLKKFCFMLRKTFPSVTFRALNELNILSETRVLSVFN